MKILFLNLYSGINNRGAESFTHALINHLSHHHEITLISGGAVEGLDCSSNIIISSPIFQPRQGDYGSFSERLLKRLFLDKGSLAVLFFSIKSLQNVVHKRYDVVVPINGFWQLLIYKVYSFFSGSKLLVTGHSGPGWDERWNLYLKPDLFIATTEPTAKWASQVGSWTKVQTIPYGIDISQFAMAKPAKLDLERPIILCNAAAVPYKRVDLAIRAVASLPKGSLLHLGDGPMKDELVKMGKDLLGDKRFLSLSVPYSETFSYYKASNLVTLPSSPQENSPMVFLEAMAAGKMCVVTDTPRNRWVLGDFGVYTDPSDLNKYKDALMRGLEMKEPLDLGHRNMFSWKNIEEKYLSVINSL